MKAFATSNWKELEEIVETLQRRFNRAAVIKRNDFIEGVNSGSRRQIDVSIRHHLGTSTLLIVVECKRVKAKIDAPRMEAFIGKMEDVRAALGIYVSERGYTEGAKNLARKRGVELYTLQDTRDGKWPTEARIKFFIEAFTLDAFALNLD